MSLFGAESLKLGPAPASLLGGFDLSSELFLAQTAQLIIALAGLASWQLATQATLGKLPACGMNAEFVSMKHGYFYKTFESPNLNKLHPREKRSERSVAKTAGSHVSMLRCCACCSLCCACCSLAPGRTPWIPTLIPPPPTSSHSRKEAEPPKESRCP